MMDICKSFTWQRLPNEILIRILKYLNTYELLQFCAVFNDLDFFLREKRFIRCTDLSNRFEIQDMNLCKFISVQMNPNCINTLKINGIYWIPGHDLRILLSNLPALEELHALDTELGIKSEDIVEYFKLKKLAVSILFQRIGNETMAACKNLTSLKHLHLKILFKEDENIRGVTSDLEKLFCNIKYLEELWIRDYTEYINYVYFVRHLKNLKKFVVRTKGLKDCYWLEGDLSPASFTRTFQGRWNHGKQVIFEKILHTEPIETTLEKAWDVFESLGPDLQCGPKEQRLLVLNEERKNIKFKELYFAHNTIIFDLKKYVKILTTDNCRGLEKLNFGWCLFQNFDEYQKQNDDGDGGSCSFKSQSIDVKSNIENHPFEKVAKNLKDLVELEIFRCRRCNCDIPAYPYSFIPNFKKLQRLNLEIPPLVDGLFLEQVFKNCQNLEYLYLRIDQKNELFLPNLYKYLPNAVSLKHLQLKCNQVNLECLLMGLAEIETKKLLRIYIHCYYIHSLSNNEQRLFSTFFETQPQLVFFVLTVKYSSTYSQPSDIQKIMDEYKNENPAKIFYCKGTNEFLTSVHNLIPSAHNDIIFDHYRVAGIDFDKF